MKSAPITKIQRIGVGANAAAMSAEDKIMLVVGPAIEIFPISSMLAGPETITAPGEIILKATGNIMKMAVSTLPHRVKRNSAHKPRRCAVTLWAISWIAKDEVKMAAETEATSSKSPPKEPVKKM